MGFNRNNSENYTAITNTMTSTMVPSNQGVNPIPRTTQKDAIPPTTSPFVAYSNVLNTRTKERKEAPKSAPMPPGTKKSRKDFSYDPH
jgi:hypothetical protein